MISLSDEPRPDAAPPYRHVSWCYDALASAYSLGTIDRAKRTHQGLINEGDRVLYAGAGRGREIVTACQRGASATCVEPCPVMAEALHNRLGSSSDGFTIVPRPIQSIPADPSYDLVVAHFFLNVFDADQMPGVLAHLCGFVKPGGRIVIADFKPSANDAGILDCAGRWLYYRPVNIAGWLLRICALHPIYDYGPLLTKKGFEITSRQTLRIFPGFGGAYEVITAHRPATHPA